MNNVINKIQKQLEELKIDNSEIVVFGSSVWEYFGIREARDIDILISDTIKKSVIGKKKNIASREIMISNVVGVGIDKFIKIGINDEDFFLNSDLTFEIKSANTNYGLRVNFADTQDRFDSKVLDVGKTAGYTTYDIFAGFEPTPNLRISIGMANISDKRYATHLNTTNRLDSAADRTDEPGRSLFGSVNYEF